MTQSASSRLSGKTVVITGGAAGIGRASSLMFAKEGARVVIIDINAEAAKETVEMIASEGGTAHFFLADVSKADQVDKAFDAIKSEIGAYDVLFNHAGTIIVKPLHESTEEDYDRLMDINVRSELLMVFGKSRSLMQQARLGKTETSPPHKVAFVSRKKSRLRLFSSHPMKPASSTAWHSMWTMVGTLRAEQTNMW